VPYRVDLFGDEVDSIRTFDPDSQRSLYPVPEVRLLPGREFPMDERRAQAFRARWRERIEGDPTRSRIYKDMGTGVATAGIEYYLPLFFDETATFFDYLGESAALVLHGEVDEALEPLLGRHARAPPLPAARPGAAHPAARGHLPAAEEFFGRCTTPHAQLSVRGSEPVEWARPLPDLSVERGGHRSAAWKHAVRLGHISSGTTAAEKPTRVLLLAEAAGRRESLLELLRDHRMEPAGGGQR
jgi:transcription-repair coupling factor (superfamily II helicase)